MAKKLFTVEVSYKTRVEAEDWDEGGALREASYGVISVPKITHLEMRVIGKHDIPQPVPEPPADQSVDQAIKEAESSIFDKPKAPADDIQF